MFKTYLTFGTVQELDFEGSASWNPHGYKPAARVLLHMPGYPMSPACRIMGFRAHAVEGVWWPHKVGDTVLVAFLERSDAPVIISGLWADENAQPENCDGTNARLVLHGHQIAFEEAGLTIQTQDGKAILLKDDYISIAHPAGQTVVMDGDGNINATVPGNLEADIEGNLEAEIDGSVDITAQGTVTIGGKLGVELNTENKISLKTLKAIAGIINRLTHPVCYLMGTPIGASESVEAGS